MSNDPANPWMFRRDELDVLEDELDAVFDLHEASSDPVTRAMEEKVLGEQSDTEDRYETKLAEVLGPEALAPDDAHECEHCKGGFPEGVPLRDLLVGERDALYARAYAWAVKAFAWSRDCYWRDGMRNRDMFRVNVNACLVPVKLAFALAEETRDDQHAPRIAGMEYDLALAYLSRTRESIGALRAMGVVTEDLPWMAKEADELMKLVTERRARFPV